MVYMNDREVRVMKGIIVLTLILLAGCAEYVPLELLEARARVSGDWSAVEKRERIIARRDLHTSMSCPNGTIGYCASFGIDKKCRCVERKEINALLFSD